MENRKYLKKSIQHAEILTVGVSKNAVLKLNDDCLLHIFSYLNIKDQYNLSHVCPRFYNIIERSFSSYKKLHLEELMNLSVTQVHEVLTKVGGTVRIVSLKNGDRFLTQQLFSFLPRYCPNIETLYIKSIALDSVGYQVLKNIFMNLTSLTLCGYCNIDESICLTLKNCDRIRYLDLSNNYRITGDHLNSLPNLKILNLSKCRNIGPVQFTELCQVSKLIELNIRNSIRLDNPLLETLLETQTDLKRLILSNPYTTKLSDIFLMPNLEYLEIWSKSEINFSERVQYKNENLKVFRLHAPKLNENQNEHIFNLIGLEELNIEIDDKLLAKLSIRNPKIKKICCLFGSELNVEAVISYIVNNYNLKTIDLSHCLLSALGFEFFSDLVDALQIANRPNSIHIILGDRHKMFESRKSKPKLDENRHLLNLSYSPWSKK